MNMISALISGVFKMITGFFRAGRGLAAAMLDRIPGAAGVFGLVSSKLLPKGAAGGELLEREALKALARLRKRGAPAQVWHRLIEGDRRGYAEAVAPSARFPELYTEVPEDLQRPLIEDGRLINGEAPAIGLAGLPVTPEFIEDCQAEAVITAKSWFFFWLIASSLAAVAGILSMSGESLHALSVSMPDVASGGWDVWPGEVPRTATLPGWFPYFAKTLNFLGSSASLIVSGALVFTCCAVFAWGAANYSYWRRLFGLVQAGVNEATAILRTPVFAARDLWRNRSDARELTLAAHRRALKFVEQRDHSPLISIGRASGVFGSRGAHGAPLADAPVKMSLLDLMQHALVIGGTGEGKTRDVLKPLMRRLIDLRKSGLPVNMMVIDDKAVLWRDLVEVAREAGVEKSIRIIGTGEDHYRVDLLADTSPAIVADLISGVAKQMSGKAKGGDDFWPQMASQLVLEIATLLQAWEHTNAGVEFVKREGYRAYSLRNILRVAQSDKLIIEVVRDVMDALGDEEQAPALQPFDSMALWASIDAHLGAWGQLADATKTGVIANARQVLRMFAFSDALRGFGDGAGPRLLKPSDLRSDLLTAIAVSAVEHGEAGKLIVVALKTLLFRHAREAEARDPNSADARLKWWSNPYPATADTSKSITVLVGDEYQGWATEADAEFSAVARSTGLALVLATQSQSALDGSLGREVTRSLSNNLRSKIFLRVEDPATFETVMKLAGTAPRFVGCENVLVAESIRAAAQQWGRDLPPASVSAVRAVVDAAGRHSQHFFSAFAGSKFDNLSRDRVELAAYAAVSMLPESWSSRPHDAELANEIAVLKAKNAGQHVTLAGIADNAPMQEIFLKSEQANWRLNAGLSEADQSLSFGKDVNWRESDIVSESDIIGMGRGAAVCFIQRGGVTRSDIVTLNQ